MAYRYALLELLPLAVVANSEAGNQRLYGGYASRLSLYDETTATGELTQSWLADRAAMVDWHALRNSKGLEGAISSSSAGGRAIAESLNYLDKASGTQILVGTADYWNQRAQIVFGGTQADTIDGYGRNDHLYGGSGSDIINGSGGSDYLEGGSGAISWKVETDRTD